MMPQPVENTAYCLNCANEWPAAWAYKEVTGVCPECGWWLGILIELVSSGWWTVWEHDAADASGMKADRRRGGKGRRQERRRSQLAEFVRVVRKYLERLSVADPRRRDVWADRARRREGGAMS